MNTAKRDKIILSVLAIVIIGVIMFYATIKPSRDEIKQLNKEISSAQQSIDGLKGKSQLINDLKTQLEEIEAQVKDAEGEMSDFDDYALYLSDFQDITENRATSTKIEFTGAAASETGHYTIVKANVSFLCKYDDLKYIMNALLENNVHCYDVVITESTAADYSDPDNIVETELLVKFTADYFSRSGVYTPIDYDFSSGRYGLSQLFDGVAIVENADTGSEEPANS